MNFKDFFRLWILVMGTILFSAFVFWIVGGKLLGVVLVIPIILVGAYFANEDDKEQAERKHFAKKMKFENLTKVPTIPGEYWKNGKITIGIVKQIFEDLEFEQAWMNVGEGGVLAWKRKELFSKDTSEYFEANKKMLIDLANDLDFDSALEEFLNYARKKFSDKFFNQDFPELFSYIVKRDLEKSFSAIEKYLESRGKIEKDDLCAIIGHIEFPEWNQLAAEVCREEKVGFYEAYFSNEEIADDSFGRDVKYFDLIEKKISSTHLMLKRYHAMMKKVNCL